MGEGSVLGRSSSHHHLRGCTCQRHPLPCQIQGPSSCTSWWVFDGFHLLVQVMCLHKVTQVGIVLRQGPVCAIPVVTDPRSFSSVMHTYSIAFSPFSDIMVQFLDFLKEASATPLFLQLHHFLSIFSLLLRLVKRIFSRGPQSPVITVHTVRRVNIGGASSRPSVVNACLWGDQTLHVIP